MRPAQRAADPAARRAPGPPISRPFRALLLLVGVLGLACPARHKRPRPPQTALPPRPLQTAVSPRPPQTAWTAPPGPVEPAPSGMPGIEELPRPEVELFWRMVTLLPSPCASKTSLWEARNAPACAPRAWRALAYVRDLIREGDLGPEVQAKYPLRYQCPRAALQLAGLPSRGRGDARVTLVEFADFQCPTCRAAEPELRRLIDRHGLKHVFVHYPLVLKHPYAEAAARGAVAAARQGQFWTFHDEVYNLQGPLTDVALQGVAAKLRLRLAQFMSDMEKARPDVARQRQIGDRLQVPGTPTFYVNGCLVQDSDVKQLEGWILDELALPVS